jgi:hypothetical protein
MTASYPRARHATRIRGVGRAARCIVRAVSDPAWVRVPVRALAAVDAAWMLFDGSRALLTGDYVTVDGRLGPWAGLVSAVGVDPRGTPMKIVFVAYGAAWLVGVAGYLGGRNWGRRAVIAGAAGSLWYLPVGTASSLLQLGLLAIGRRRSRRRASAGECA